MYYFTIQSAGQLLREAHHSPRCLYKVLVEKAFLKLYNSVKSISHSMVMKTQSFLDKNIIMNIIWLIRRRIAHESKLKLHFEALCLFMAQPICRFFPGAGLKFLMWGNKRDCSNVCVAKNKVRAHLFVEQN